MTTNERAECSHQDEFEYIGSSDPMLDLAVLSSCDHIVASGGTFSWWAAFLGPTQKGGIVIHSSRLWTGAYENPTEWIPIVDSFSSSSIENKVDGNKRLKNFPSSESRFLCSRSHHRTRAACRMSKMARTKREPAGIFNLIRIMKRMRL